MLKASKLMLCAFINCSTYEVATACALAIGAEKLICVIDGPILDENERLIRFLTLQDADTLIRKRAKQSEIAANYVKAVDEEDLAYKAVGEEDLAYFEHSDSNGALTSPQNGKGSSEMYSATFQNGVGFDNGNGLWSGEQGFAIGGQERLSRLNGFLSELAAAAFVCRVSLLSTDILFYLYPLYQISIYIRKRLSFIVPSILLLFSCKSNCYFS